MVYSNLLLDGDSSNNENNKTVVVQDNGSPEGTKILYNEKDLSLITGPVPFVGISTSVQKNSSDIPSIQTTSITLEGKIVRYNNPADNINLEPPGSGITGLLGAASGLDSLFRSCPFGNFKIECDGASIFTASGSTLTDISFNQTPDNWTSTIDYTVSLEQVTPLSGLSSEDWVTDKTDRWSVESLDNTYATFLQNDISHQRPEFSNPILGASPGSTIPSRNVGGGNTSSTSIDIIDIPQFRITHTVSARGLTKPSGDCLNSEDARSNNLSQARDWVLAQIDRGVVDSTTQASGVMPFVVWPPNGNGGGSTPNTNLYNHVRSINIDYNNYEITESWLALPTGIPYTEEYTIETSTSEDMTKTVRVVGNIAGLQLYSQDPALDIAPASGINLNAESPADRTVAYQKLDDQTKTGAVPSMNGSARYGNAITGWTDDIKPHLYRRACIGMNSSDRTLNYTNPAKTTDPPNNPIYSKERPLSPTCNSLTESHNPRKGTIGYTAEYNNRLRIISGVLSENIDVSFAVPRDEVATIAVPGRALGPILSRTGRSASTKTINISIVVVPPSSVEGTLLTRAECPLYTGGRVYNTIQDLIIGNQPFVSSKLITAKNVNGLVYTQSDNESWSANQGRYSRSVTWIYQNCEIGKGYMDH